MDLYRFYAPNLLPDGPPELDLPESEAHHARNVLRLQTGTHISLFNGHGAVATAKITRLAKHGLAVSLLETPRLQPPPAPVLTLATALPKGERADWLVEQASQLNVTALHFLECDRSVVKLRASEGHKLDKWKRLAIESAKQCGRAHLLDLRDPLKPADLHPPAPSEPAAPRILWLDPHPAGTTVPHALAQWPGPILALIGPEGGWSAPERAFLEQAVADGWIHRVRLTPTILRIETACTALAAAVMCR